MTTTPSTPVVVLTIAGSDSSGGAGIQADLRTFAALGVHGACAVSAVTAQSTTAVDAVHVVPPELLLAQIDTVLDDLDVAAVKTGMLATAAGVRVVADLARQGRLPNLVVDPVMVASTGARLLDAGAESAYLTELLPLARVATPNRREAEVLCGRPLRDVDQVAAAAAELQRCGPEVVVIKGGDPEDQGGEAGEAIDVVAESGGLHLLRAPRVPTRNDHGTGCSFASALAARLALGDGPLAALRFAKEFVRRGLAGAAGWHLGAGHGPIDHLGWSEAFPSPTTRPRSTP